MVNMVSTIDPSHNMAVFSGEKASPASCLLFFACLKTFWRTYVAFDFGGEDNTLSDHLGQCQGTFTKRLHTHYRSQRANLAQLARHVECRGMDGCGCCTDVKDPSRRPTRKLQYPTPKCLFVLGHCHRSTAHWHIPNLPRATCHPRTRCSCLSIVSASCRLPDPLCKYGHCSTSTS